MTRKKRSVRPNDQDGLESLAYRLDALLHTMRCITQYEDALCELAHEVKRCATLNAKTSNHLRILLDKIPAQEYVHDLDSVKEDLALLASRRKAIKTTEKSRPSVNGKKTAQNSAKRTVTRTVTRA